MTTKRKILYIEDNHKDLKFLQNHFVSENLPFNLTTVNSVPDAKEELRSFGFDLVLCEYQLGEFTAFNLIDDLEEIPFIILTRKGSESIALQALKSGASDYLIKDPQKNYLSDLSTATVSTFHEMDQKKEDQLYQKQLEEIVAERTHVLLESNQRLSEEALQRAQALEDLKESREVYRRFFQTSRDAVFISSLEGRWIDMNLAAIELFGYQDRDQIWSDSILDLYWESDARRKYTQTIQEHGFDKDYPIKLRKKDGVVLMH